jgi:hypothetical protein
VDTLRGVLIGVQYFGTVENVVVTVSFAAIANLIGIQAFKRMRA